MIAFQSSSSVVGAAEKKTSRNNESPNWKTCPAAHAKYFATLMKSHVVSSTLCYVLLQLT